MAQKFVKAIGLHNLFDVSNGSLDTTHIKKSVTTANLRSIIFSTADSTDEAYGFRAGAKYIWTYGDLYDCNNTDSSVNPASENVAGIVKITDRLDTSASDMTVSSKAITKLINEINESEYVIADSLTDLNSRLVDISTKMSGIGYTEITYSELKNLKNSSKLNPGQQYRITDFVTTTLQANTQSANHQFDIIVTADSSSILNENARAILHEGDTYFQGCNLEAWEIKYCINNDTNRFAWANANGKGVIYYMKDEWNNECWYDFKNIQFKRYEITDSSILAFKTNDSENNPNGFYYGAYKLDGNEVLDNAVYSSNFIWCYTFTYKNLSNNTWFDGSMVGNKFSTEGDVCCKDNSIESGNAYYDDDYWYNQQYLNDIVFYGCAGNNDGESPCYDNKIKAGCFIITFGKGAYGNNINMYNYYNTFGNDCCSNTFGNSCGSNTFGNSCYSNTFGNSCSSNTFGNSCYSNTFGNSCGSNTFGNSSTIKSYYRYIIFDNGNRYIRLNATDTTSGSAYFQNIHVGLGVNNTTTYKDIDIAGTNQTYQTTIVPNNSVTVTI